MDIEELKKSLLESLKVFEKEEINEILGNIEEELKKTIIIISLSS